MAYKIDKPKRSLGDQAYVAEAVKGLGLTISRFFKNTFSKEENKVIATVRYPDEVREYPERFRGVHRLTHRTDGSTGNTTAGPSPDATPCCGPSVATDGKRSGTVQGGRRNA